MSSKWARIKVLFLCVFVSLLIGQTPQKEQVTQVELHYTNVQNMLNERISTDVLFLLRVETTEDGIKISFDDVQGDGVQRHSKTAGTQRTTLHVNDLLTRLRDVVVMVTRKHGLVTKIMFEHNDKKFLTHNFIAFSSSGRASVSPPQAIIDAAQILSNVVWDVPVNAKVGDRLEVNSRSANRQNGGYSSEFLPSMFYCGEVDDQGSLVFRANESLSQRPTGRSWLCMQSTLRVPANRALVCGQRFEKWTSMELGPNISRSNQERSPVCIGYTLCEVTVRQ